LEEQISRLADTRTRIIVVDDEPDTLLPLTRALEADNYAVVGALPMPRKRFERSAMRRLA